MAHLVLWHGTAKTADVVAVLASDATAGIAVLLSGDWRTFTEVHAHTILGWEEGSGASGYAALMREGVSREGYIEQVAALVQFDVSDILAELRVPTLVLARRGEPVWGDFSRSLASQIPGAQLTFLEGDKGTPYLGDYQSVVDTINGFLREGEEQAAAPPAAPARPEPVEGPSSTAVIFFADIAGSTALTERLGDAAFRAKARELAASLRVVIRECAGTPVEGPTLGDGVLAVFTSAREAIGAALACGEAGAGAGLPLHLGLHAGDVTREKDPDGWDNVYGGAVNIASRISGAVGSG